jgi:hypothetical protein
LPSWSPTCFTCPAHTGLACSDGLFQNRRQVQKTDAANWSAGRRLLLNRAVEAAVIENGAEVILGQGLAYDRCSVGVVTNIAFDDEDLSRWDVQPTGGEYYTTPRSIYRTQVDVVLPSGHAVLNAEDPLVADFAELCDGEVIFFTADPSCLKLAEHFAAGKRGVTVADGRIVLRTGTDEIRLCRLVDVPLHRQGQEAERHRQCAGRYCRRLGAGPGQGSADHRREDLRPRTGRAGSAAPHSGQEAAARPCGNNKDQASWTFPAFVPCAAPTCGAGTPPSRPSFPARAEVAISDLPGFEARLRERFRNWAT